MKILRIEIKGFFLNVNINGKVLGKCLLDMHRTLLAFLHKWLHENIKD